MYPSVLHRCACLNFLRVSCHIRFTVLLSLLPTTESCLCNLSHTLSTAVFASGNFVAFWNGLAPWAGLLIQETVLCEVARFFCFCSGAGAFFVATVPRKGLLGSSTPLVVPLLLCWCCCFRSCFGCCFAATFADVLVIAPFAALFFVAFASLLLLLLLHCLSPVLPEIEGYYLPTESARPPCLEPSCPGLTLNRPALDRSSPDHPKCRGFLFPLPRKQNDFVSSLLEPFYVLLSPFWCLDKPGLSGTSCDTQAAPSSKAAGAPQDDPENSKRAF